MKRILVIGNGFDIAHGIPTSYDDFIAFMRLFICDADIDIHNRNIEKISAAVKLLSENITLMDELKRLINNYWYHHFLEVEKKNGWVGFENEIKDTIHAIDNYRNHELNRKSPERFITYKALRYFMGNGRLVVDSELSKQKDNEAIDKCVGLFIRDLKKLIRCLEIYLETISKVVPITKIPLFENRDFDAVLSFNYTYTFSRLYDPSYKCAYDFIHGKSNLDNNMRTNNMVLGIDEFSDEIAKIHDTRFIQFKKYFQRIHKRTGCQYKNWLDNSGETSHEIYIYGHSLDVTDREVLSDLLRHPYTKVVIYHHSPEAYANQIANLVKVLDKNTLINMVYGDNRKILFKHIDDSPEEEWAFLNPDKLKVQKLFESQRATH